MNLQLSRQSGSNRWPAAYKAAALPTELCRRNGFSIRAHYYNRGILLVKQFFNFVTFVLKNFLPSLQTVIILQGFFSFQRNMTFLWKQEIRNKKLTAVPTVHVGYTAVYRSDLFFQKNKFVTSFLPDISDNGFHGKIIAVIEMMRGFAALW